MNTESKKIVVVLLILQSCQNELYVYERCVYVVLDQYLVSQVIEEANNLGIKVTDNINDYNFCQKKAILVNTIYH